MGLLEKLERRIQKILIGVSESMKRKQDPKMCRMPHIEASPCIFTHVPIVPSFFPGCTDPFALSYAYFIKTLINSAPYVVPYYFLDTVPS
jgi:sensor domain CHASE-containing protein